MDRATLDRLVAKGFEFDQRYYELADMQTKYNLEKEKKTDNKNYLISGYWSSDKDGKRIVTKASLGTVIYFHIKTSGIEKNANIKLKLHENDGGFSKDDEKFPTVIQNKSSHKKSINDLEIIKSTNLDNSGKATIELKLEESWASMIEDDFGFEIELYWQAYEKNTFFKVKD